MRVNDQYWWGALSIKGIIVDIMMSKAGDSIAVVYLACMRLIVGDKLTTYPALKFMVGELVPYVPSIVDEASGQSFRHNILISTKNVARGLGG